MASCCVSDEPPCTTSLARRFSTSARERAEEVDAEVLEEAAVLGGERRLDDGVGDLLERHGVVVQDAALADLVARRVEELDAVAAGEEAALVELHEGGERQREQ